MNYALHGNLGLPEDVHDLLRAADGLGASPHLWRALAEHPRTATLPGFAKFLNELAAPDVLRPRVLLGYSLGGRLALHALTQKPQLWDAAVLVSAHPGLRTEEERAARLVRDQAWAARFRTEPWAEVMAAWNEQEVFRSSTFQSRVPETNELESWRPQIALAFDAWSLGRQADLRPLLPGVKCPVLWLTGAEDAKFTALAAESCALLPHAAHVVIPGAGHRVHLDQPAATADAVVSFLRDIR